MELDPGLQRFLLSSLQSILTVLHIYCFFMLFHHLHVIDIWVISSVPHVNGTNMWLLYFHLKSHRDFILSVECHGILKILRILMKNSSWSFLWLSFIPLPTSTSCILLSCPPTSRSWIWWWISRYQRHKEPSHSYIDAKLEQVFRRTEETCLMNARDMVRGDSRGGWITWSTSQPISCLIIEIRFCLDFLYFAFAYPPINCIKPYAQRNEIKQERFCFVSLNQQKIIYSTFPGSVSTCDNAWSYEPRFALVRHGDITEIRIRYVCSMNHEFHCFSFALRWMEIHPLSPDKGQSLAPSALWAFVLHGDIWERMVICLAMNVQLIINIFTQIKIIRLFHR